MKWYVIRWMKGGTTLVVTLAGKVGFTSDLRQAAVYDSREEATKACKRSGWTRRSVPECEEVVMRYLTQQEISGG